MQPITRSLLIVVATHCASIACADLTLQVWANGAFAPPTLAATSVVPHVTLPVALADYSSLRYTGTIASTASQLMTFTAMTEGGVRLWIDDHLVIDDGATHVPSATARDGYLIVVHIAHRSLVVLIDQLRSNIPFVAGVPQPFRLEYSRWTSGTAALSLRWSGNVTAAQEVPTSAFTPTVSPAEVERVRLRDRLINPAVAWQTYNNPTMGSHVLMPAGLIVDATLADLSTGDVLGDIIVFRRSNPALSLAGLHSLNGSDYTQLSLSRWGKRICDVSFETTVDAAGVNLRFLATSNGSDCEHLALLVKPAMMDERPGSFSGGAGTAQALVATVPGFGSVTVTAVGATSVVFPNATGDVYFALPLGGVVGYVTGAAPPPSVADIQASIAAARAIVVASKSRYGDLADIYEAMESILTWNTMFTPIEGVVTPVSRGWDFGEGYVIFDWDNLFLSYMASLEPGTLKDISYANLIQIIQARTLLGFVPNYASGMSVSFDRTEPQIGALVVQKIHAKWGDDWLVNFTFPALLSWNEWVWQHRRGEGVLAGPDGHADLIVLGSDSTNPEGPIGGYNTMQCARYESGLDNSPMYDGNDTDSQGDGPVRFDNTSTHHMSLYDVGMTALYLSDTEALIDLASIAGRVDVVRTLQVRFAAVQTAMNAHMWDADVGMYTNVLYNGSFYRRHSPTSFFPMLSGSASDAQVDALMRTFTSPTGFCFNRSYVPHANAAMLVQWWNGKHDNAGCITEECIAERVDDAYNFVRVEAVLLTPDAAAAPGFVAVNLYYSAANADYALVAGGPPDAGYELVRQEGWCFATDALPPPGTWPLANLTLWWSLSRKDLKTCGSTVCEADVGPDYVQRGGVMCVAYSGTGAENLPCKYGGSSIARGDAAFIDNNYWRGRIWGPHYQRYSHLPSVVNARLEMVAMGKALMLQNWYSFHQVIENANGLIGIGEDVGNADPFYHWGALFGFLSFIEHSVY